MRSNVSRVDRRIHVVIVEFCRKRRGRDPGPRGRDLELGSRPELEGPNGGPTVPARERERERKTARATDSRLDPNTPLLGERRRRIRRKAHRRELGSSMSLASLNARRQSTASRARSDGTNR